MLLGEEGAVQGLFQLADLAAHPVPRASWASTLGLRSPAMIASSMSRPETPWMSVITLDSFRCASSSSFSARCYLGGAGLGQVPPVAGVGAQPADRPPGARSWRAASPAR